MADKNQLATLPGLTSHLLHLPVSILPPGEPRRIHKGGTGGSSLIVTEAQCLVAVAVVLARAKLPSLY